MNSATKPGGVAWSIETSLHNRGSPSKKANETGQINRNSELGAIDQHAGSQETLKMRIPRDWRLVAPYVIAGLLMCRSSGWFF
jgi:hypothetical protein